MSRKRTFFRSLNVHTLPFVDRVVLQRGATRRGALHARQRHGAAREHG
ncbi:hypothetical protein KPG66_02060 [Mycetohabitans sp. B2]|nr:hypothetical protein [Mycetohabitans sp. B2]MCF7694948.1 hypothetical protein [Mycetohabitans sp. B2]